MRGIVLNVDLKSDSGLIRGDDGTRRAFAMSACRAGVPLEGALVDFEIENDACVDVYILSTPIKAKLDWLFWFLFSPRGRISRDQLIVFLASAASILPLPVLCATLAGSATLSITGGVLSFYVFCAVLIKRFHDSDGSAFWLVFTLCQTLFLTLVYSGVLKGVPAAGVWAFIALLCLSALFCLYLCLAKGSFGNNRYGAEPYVSRTVRLK